jgi:hypothetical protein
VFGLGCDCVGRDEPTGSRDSDLVLLVIRNHRRWDGIPIVDKYLAGPTDLFWGHIYMDLHLLHMYVRYVDDLQN